jgi:DNA-binding response OmpR family regulator
MSDMSNRFPPHVMIVEDDAAIGHMYQLGLELSAFRVTVLTDVSSFFQAIEGEIPDVAVLDFQLQGEITGIDILENLRLDDRAVDLPVFVLSNHSGALDDQMDRATAAGAMGWLLKSETSPIQLAARIEDALRSRAQADRSLGVMTQGLYINTEPAA